MTDTPRTLTELLAMFPNNNSAKVTAQNMRDLIVSIANPIDEGGLDPTKLSTETYLQIYTNPIAGTNRPKATASPAGQWNFPPNQIGITLTQLRDQGGVWRDGVVSDWAAGPEAWIDKNYHIAASNPRNAYGGYGMDIDSAFMLPPGVFDIYLYGNFTPAIDWGQSFSRNVQLYFDQAEWDGGVTDVATQQARVKAHARGAWYEAYYNPLFTYYQSPPYVSAPTNWSNYQAVQRVFNDADEPRPFILVAFQKDVTHDSFFTVVGVNLVKIR